MNDREWKPPSLPGLRVLVTGGTGFIGTALCRRLLDEGAQVSVLTRDRRRAVEHFEGSVTALESLAEIEAASAPQVVVNLAGRNLGSERWNDAVKRELVASRVETTRRVIDYIACATVRPDVLISGSAVGYYGARGDTPLTETSPPGREYQADLCQRWEDTALQAQEYGVRACLSRTGVVMGPGGGALSGLAPQFRRGLGAVVGSGRQWIAWIHLDDLIDIFIECMLNPELSGAFNNTSPYPVTNREFAKTLGQVLHRPVRLRVPGPVLRLMMGEMAHLYLTGQKVLPARHLERGYTYRYPRIREAFTAALQRC